MAESPEYEVKIEHCIAEAHREPKCRQRKRKNMCPHLKVLVSLVTSTSLNRTQETYVVYVYKVSMIRKYHNQKKLQTNP